MNSLSMTLVLSPAEICTAQQKGERVIGKYIQHYTKPEVKRSKAKIRQSVFDAARANNIPMRLKTKVIDGKMLSVPCFTETFIDCPISLAVDYYYPVNRPKKYLGKVLWRTKRPDLDNLTKSILDCMTDMELWADDSQVACLMLTKQEVDNGNGHITISAVQSDTKAEIPLP
jgi:Holliday junction resolvase RusA-like endonuclease